jgi:hypothetical protein
MVNWNTILANVDENDVRGFATGVLSGRELTQEASFSDAAGEVRKLLRTYGVSKARQVARKALSRRD